MVGAQNEHSMSKKSKIRLLLVDDHPVVREGIRSCLHSHERLEVVGEASNGNEAVAKAQSLKPDVVLMDINLPQMDGLTATERILAASPLCQVLIMTAHKNREYAERAINIGARGYVLKEAPPQELIQAILDVHSGEPFFSTSVANSLLGGMVGSENREDSGGGCAITKREREVLIAIAEGNSNKEIASLLNVSVRTVETHRERLMAKLEIRNVAGLTRYAISQGWVRVDNAP